MDRPFLRQSYVPEYPYSSHIVGFCCLVRTDFTHILQGYFTGTGANDCPSASEATLKNMGKQVRSIHLLV